MELARESFGSPFCDGSLGNNQQYHGPVNPVSGGRWHCHPGNAVAEFRPAARSTIHCPRV
jgi:hypothetical protein